MNVSVNRSRKRAAANGAFTGKRARSAEAKAERRRAILDAAEHHFVAVGFEAFSMARLAALAGVAKGTLYLYFETREEVLLALHLEQLDRWGDALLSAVGLECSDEAFVRAFFATAYEDPALLPLLSRLDSVIEHNVPLEVLIDAKRRMARQLDALVEGLTTPLGLEAERLYEALVAFASLLMGAAQVDLGPKLDQRRLPADVKRMAQAFSSETLFVRNALRILGAIRAGYPDNP